MTQVTPCSPSLHAFSPDEQVELAEMLDRYLAGWETGAPPSIEDLVQDRPAMAEAMRAYTEQLDQIQDALKADPRKPFAIHEPKHAIGVSGPQMRLGDYMLLAEIGRGGMGIVYRARQLSLGRDVAIKTLPFASVLDPKQIKRFQNEAQAAGQLHHPNIVPVYAVGCERGVHYYSMQLIEGLSLEQVINDLRSGSSQDVRHQTTIAQPSDPETSYRERQSVDRKSETVVEKNSATFASIRNRSHIESSVRIVIQAAEALHYAHQCGVIHRDIKPSNLMLDGRSNLWITDFGLARCQQTTPMSVTGDLMGTLRYMSPEQASGRVHAVDHRTDIYALGITLYELLTLHFAFDAVNRLELISLINETAPVPPRKLNPAIPADLETILSKAIAREPLERYESAGDFADDLHRFMRGEQPLAKRPSPLELSVKWIGHHQHLFLAIASALLLVIGGLLVTTLLISAQQRKTIAANRRADLYLQQTNQVVHAFGNVVIERLLDSGESGEVRQEVLGELKKYYQDFLQYAAQQKGMLHQEGMEVQIGEAHLRLADVYRHEGQIDASVQHLDLAIDVLSGEQANPKVTSTSNSLLVHAYSLLAKIQAKEKHFGAWQVTMEKAMAVQQGLVEREPKNNEHLLSLVALQCQVGDEWLQEDPSRAAWPFEVAIGHLDTLLAAPLSDAEKVRVLQLDSTCHNNLASVQHEVDAALAEQLIQRAIDSAEKALELEPSVTRHRQQLAAVLVNAAAISQSENLIERADERYAAAISHGRNLVESFPKNRTFRLELAANQNSFGQFLLTGGRLKEAQTAFEEAIESLEATAHDEKMPAAVLSDLASAHNNLGLAYERQQNDEDASLCYLRSLQTQKLAIKADPDNHQYVDRLVLHERNVARLKSESIVPSQALQTTSLRFTD